jgi:DNA-binding transcriptional regulator YiaG
MAELHFPRLIKAVRLDLQETQAKFAKRFRSHSNTVSRWESGEYQAPYKVLSFVMKRHLEIESLTCPVCKGRGVI